MTLSSMTGFARAQGALGDWSWEWEMRSVNGKGLDMRLRLPPGVDGLEAEVRKTVQGRCARGNLQIHLQVDRAESQDAYRINHDWLGQLIEAAQKIDPMRPVQTEALMSVRGVVETARDEPDAEAIEARNKALLTSLGEAVSALVQSRQEEGARLLQVLKATVDELEALVSSAEAQEALRPEARKQRLEAALKDLLEADPPLAEDRLAQELALQMVRGDITEELDRLKAHIAQARDLLASAEPVGRRLDFLAQEFNREANTLCSKSADVALTRIGMDMKVAIDRMREQVQNIE